MDKAKRTTLQTQAAKTYNDAQKKQRPLSVPIHQSVNFEAVSSRQLGNDFRGKSEFVYQRFGHPTSRAAAEKIALLEEAELGLVFSSGMGAISTSLLAMAGSAGSHIVAQRAIFAQTLTFLSGPLHDLRVETTFIDARDLKQVRRSIRHNTRLIYIESPSNPLLNVTDISAVSAIAKEKDIPVMIDGTFASPYLQNPIALGASVVLHSATKFLGGHSDVLCGAAAGDRDLISKIAEMQILLGTTLDPHACWLLLRGIKTLGVRVQKQSDSALAIARFLESKDVVENVRYPWLESSPGHETARRQMRGGGGVVSFELKGGYAAARKFVDALQLIPVATSLGGVETIIEIPADLDFSEGELGDTSRGLGIASGLIRLSVGIEDLDDLLADLSLGLEAAASLREAVPEPLYRKTIGVE